MRSKTTLLARCIFGLALTMLALSPAIASTPASRPEGPTDPNFPASVTFDVRARVEQVGGESTIVLVDLENDARHVIQLDDTVKIRARKKKAFNGRKKLGFADLRAGQLVKVTARTEDGQIQSITVLRAA